MYNLIYKYLNYNYFLKRKSFIDCKPKLKTQNVQKRCKHRVYKITLKFAYVMNMKYNKSWHNNNMISLFNKYFVTYLLFRIMNTSLSIAVIFSNNPNRWDFFQKTWWVFWGLIVGRKVCWSRAIKMFWFYHVTVPSRRVPK